MIIYELQSSTTAIYWQIYFLLRYFSFSVQFYMNDYPYRDLMYRLFAPSMIWQPRMVSLISSTIFWCEVYMSILRFCSMWLISTGDPTVIECGWYAPYHDLVVAIDFPWVPLPLFGDEVKFPSGDFRHSTCARLCVLAPRFNWIFTALCLQSWVLVSGGSRSRPNHIQKNCPFRPMMAITSDLW